MNINDNIDLQKVVYVVLLDKLPVFYSHKECDVFERTHKVAKIIEENQFRIGYEGLIDFDEEMDTLKVYRILDWVLFRQYVEVARLEIVPVEHVDSLFNE